MSENECYTCVSVEVFESDTIPNGTCIAAKVGPFETEELRDGWNNRFMLDVPGSMGLMVAVSPAQEYQVAGCAYIPGVIQPGLYVAVMRTIIDRYADMMSDDLRELTLTPIMKVVADSL